MELVQLRQLVAIAEEGVLSRAAETLHISQPALSRSIQHLEDELGIALFDRKKNSMVLNEAGEGVVARAKAVLGEVDALLQTVQSLKTAQRTLRVVTCAPAPLWKLAAEISSPFPQLKIVSDMPDEHDLISLLLAEKADVAIVNGRVESEAIESVALLDEQLFMQIPAGHRLARRSDIRFADLAGETLLEYTKTGFWHQVHRDEIPGATYVEYDDIMVYMNVIKSPALPTFVTELGHTKSEERAGCTTIPIVDERATAHYHLAFLKKNEAALRDVVHWAVQAARGW